MLRMRHRRCHSNGNNMSLAASLPGGTTVAVSSSGPPPGALQDWLNHELEIRGIDACIYTRYVLSLLQQEYLEPEGFDAELFPQSKKSPSGPSGGKSISRTYRHNHQMDKSGDTEKLKKSAAVECLLSASEQESSGIESLVEELCVKLKTLQSSADANQNIDTLLLDANSPPLSNKHNNKHQDNKLETTATDNSKQPPKSPQELANQYYAAFPALQSEQQSSSSQPAAAPVGPTSPGSAAWKRWYSTRNSMSKETQLQLESAAGDDDQQKENIPRRGRLLPNTTTSSSNNKVQYDSSAARNKNKIQGKLARSGRAQSWPQHHENNQKSGGKRGKYKQAGKRPPYRKTESLNWAPSSGMYCTAEFCCHPDPPVTCMPFMEGGTWYIEDDIMPTIYDHTGSDDMANNRKPLYAREAAPQRATKADQYILDISAGADLFDDSGIVEEYAKSRKPLYRRQPEESVFEESEEQQHLEDTEETIYSNSERRLYNRKSSSDSQQQLQSESTFGDSMLEGAEIFYTPLQSPFSTIMESTAATTAPPPPRCNAPVLHPVGSPLSDVDEDEILAQSKAIIAKYQKPRSAFSSLDSSTPSSFTTNPATSSSPSPLGGISSAVSVADAKAESCSTPISSTSCLPIREDCFRLSGNFNAEIQALADEMNAGAPDEDTNERVRKESLKDVNQLLRLDQLADIWAKQSAAAVWPPPDTTTDSSSHMWDAGEGAACSTCEESEGSVWDASVASEETKAGMWDMPETTTTAAPKPEEASATTTEEEEDWSLMPEANLEEEYASSWSMVHGKRPARDSSKLDSDYYHLLSWYPQVHDNVYSGIYGPEENFMLQRTVHPPTIGHKGGRSAFANVQSNYIVGRYGQEEAEAASFRQQLSVGVSGHGAVGGDRWWSVPKKNLYTSPDTHFKPIRSWEDEEAERRGEDDGASVLRVAAAAVDLALRGECIYQLDPHSSYQYYTYRATTNNEFIPKFKVAGENKCSQTDVHGLDDEGFYESHMSHEDDVMPYTYRPHIGSKPRRSLDLQPSQSIRSPLVYGHNMFDSCSTRTASQTGDSRPDTGAAAGLGRSGGFRVNRTHSDDHELRPVTDDPAVLDCSLTGHTWASPCMQPANSNKWSIGRKEYTGVGSLGLNTSVSSKVLDPLLYTGRRMIPRGKAKFSTELEEEWLASDKNDGIMAPHRERNKSGSSHSSSLRKPCSFYMEGHCRRRDCKYSHDLSAITCRFWEDGACFKGSTCPFLHGYHGCIDDRKPVNSSKD